MEEETLSWTTEHTSEKMSHDFGNGFKIVVDKKLNVAFKMKGFEVKESFSTEAMLLETYEQILVNFAKSVK